MISYADFITLLMIFFVVLYAMSKVDQKKYAALSRSLNMTMGGGVSGGILQGTTVPVDLKGLPPESVGGEEKPTETSAISVDAEVSPEGVEIRQMAELERKLNDYFRQQGMGNAVETHIDERGLVVSLKDAILFDSGHADIKNDMVGRLVQIGRTINTLENYIRIEGHTDNSPISTSAFRSNWELSVLRATTVLRLFTDMAGVPPQKLSAVGYGEYRPLNDNSTSEARARNRRVDIIILSSRFDDLERVQSSPGQNRQTP